MESAIRMTYEPGQFSQVNLQDGTKVLVSVGGTDIRVVKLGFLNIPVGNLWTFEFGFPIRVSSSTTTEQAKRAMNAVVAVVEGCLTLDEVQRKLSVDGARLLASAVGAKGAQEVGESLKMMENELLKKNTTGVNMIQMAMFVRLCTRFVRTFPEETARLLAAAVVNELFFRPPGNQEAADFLKRNYSQVQEEIANLRTDEEIRTAFTQAIRVQWTILHAQGKISPKETVAQLEQRRNMGILMPGGEIPQVDAFLQLATEFYQSAIRSS